MSLKTAMAADLDVIFNTDEHAQEIEVDAGDGVQTIVAILYDDDFEFYDGKQMGAVQNGQTLICRSTDLSRPTPSQELVIDGTKWTVIKAAEAGGALTIDLMRFEPWRA